MISRLCLRNTKVMGQNRERYDAIIPKNMGPTHKDATTRRNRTKDHHGTDKGSEYDLPDKAGTEGKSPPVGRPPWSTDRWAPPLSTDFCTPPYLDMRKIDI